jgi:hypothetical protein
MSRTEPKLVRPSIIPPLQSGDQLTRAEFERRYDATPNIKKAELINGVDARRRDRLLHFARWHVRSARG